MSIRWRRSSCALVALCLLLALSCASVGVRAQGTAEVTRCSEDCATFHKACVTRNRKALADCRAMHGCGSNSTCDEECKYACATCTSQPGYFVKTGCTKALVSCVSTCR